MKKENNSLKNIKEKIKQLSKTKKIICLVIIVAIIIIIAVIIWRQSQSGKIVEVGDTKSGVEICLIDAKNRLKDPSSLKVNDSYTLRKNGEIEYYLIDITANNSFGGVSRSYFLYSKIYRYIGTDKDTTVKNILEDKSYEMVSTSTSEEMDKYQ